MAALCIEESGSGCPWGSTWKCWSERTKRLDAKRLSVKGPWRAGLWVERLRNYVVMSLGESSAVLFADLRIGIVRKQPGLFGLGCTDLT